MNAGIDTQESSMNTEEIIDRIFKDPATKYELTEFENIGKAIHDILAIYPKTAVTGRGAGKTRYYLKSIVPFSSGNEEVQVYAKDGKANPEEIIRQLWVYKLINQDGYKTDEIDLEASVQCGTEVGTKAADIIVYTDNTKETPKIIVECKKPKRKDGIEQLKSYMNAKGAPVAVWSNSSDSIILYRPYSKEFSDTLQKLSTDLVTRFDVICIEDLALRNRVKNHNLARSLHDASIGTAVRMIEEKAKLYGKTTVKIDRVDMEVPRYFRIGSDRTGQFQFGLRVKVDILSFSPSTAP